LYEWGTGRKGIKQVVNVADESRPFVKVERLTMEFGGQLALDAVDMDILRGEVHGLVGENGSGKSTLIKILAGFYVPLAGALEVAGQPIPLPLHPGQFRELGFAFVHQNLGLIPSLTVLENLIIDKLARPRQRAIIRWRRELKHAAELLERIDVRIDPRRLVADLKPIERALLTIVRAVRFSMDIEKDGNVSPVHRVRPIRHRPPGSCCRPSLPRSSEQLPYSPAGSMCRVP
jgi:ribose transport system ATP-binding protein